MPALLKLPARREGRDMAKGNIPVFQSGDGGLTRYLEEIRRFPMLEPQQEYMLAKRYLEHGDRDALSRLWFADR
jgi:RNA polymerase sigma-32 factor